MYVSGSKLLIGCHCDAIMKKCQGQHCGRIAHFRGNWCCARCTVGQGHGGSCTKCWYLPCDEDDGPPIPGVVQDSLHTREAMKRVNEEKGEPRTKAFKGPESSQEAWLEEPREGDEWCVTGRWGFLQLRQREEPPWVNPTPIHSTPPDLEERSTPLWVYSQVGGNLKTVKRRIM